MPVTENGQRLIPEVVITIAKSNGRSTPSPGSLASPPRKRRKLVSTSTSPGQSASELHIFDCVAVPAAKYDVSIEPQSNMYDLQSDELIEDRDLRINGEMMPERRETRNCRSNGELPVRLLCDFSLYKWESRKFCSIFENNIGASGLVSPLVEDEDEENVSLAGTFDGENDDENDMAALCRQRVKLSKVQDIWMDPKFEDSLARIWLRTKYAWYILQTPSESYMPYFKSVFVVHLMSYLIATALKSNPNIKYNLFIEMLEVGENSSDAAATAMMVLGRSLNVNDLKADNTNPFIRDNIFEWLSLRVYKHLRDSALVKSILGSDISWPVDYTYSSDESSSGSSYDDLMAKKKRYRTRVYDSSSNLEKEVLKHKERIVVTPVVNRIARGLFYRTLVVSGQEFESGEENANICNPRVPLVVHEDNPSSIEWGNRHPGQKYFYQSVYIDGVEYKPGDTVIVEKGEDNDSIDSANAALGSAQTKNKLGNEKWFITIEYLYEENPGTNRAEKVFHGRWFQHSSQTLLAETSNPRTLFLMNKCDTNPLSCIVQKCHIQKLKSTEKEPILSDDEETADEFHYGFVWDRENLRYTDVDLEDRSIIEKFCEPHKHCYNCALEEQNVLLRVQKDFRTSLSIRGSTYHQYDFVYFCEQASDLLRVGQIVDLVKESSDIKINVFGRYQDLSFHDSHDPLVQRHLFKTSIFVTVPANVLADHCVVQHRDLIKDLSEWTDLDDHFFVTHSAENLRPYNPVELIIFPPKNLQTCDMCWSRRNAILRASYECKRNNRKLRALELFSGAGGLSQGMEMSGYVETICAVEFSPGAAQSYRKNHPKAKVYTEDTNSFLQRAMKQSTLAATGPRELPMPGEVDLIMGGPPCQSFSGMNRYKKADDIRDTLVCNMLSYVEYYRPKYFLLENVVGLLLARLQGKQDGRRIIGGIESGIIKFIMRTLTALGYQASFKILQAAQYGAPQNRNRVIVWGARRGFKLPAFPKPTHVSKKPSYYYKVATIGVVRPVSRMEFRGDEEEIGNNYAPFPMVTIKDAIDDLPAFDWIDPHRLLKATLKDREEAMFRALTIQQLPGHPPEASDGVSGFINRQPYDHQPYTQYQAWSRRGMPTDEGVKNHYMRSFIPEVVERVVNVPLRPGADHADLPTPLLRVKKVSGQAFDKARGTYSRLDGNGLFHTAMTVVRPNSKTRCIHPSQKRSLTVRECARAQGFPDIYEFCSVNKEQSLIIDDQYRQIGNAVPIPLALALGKALGEVLIETMLSDVWVEDSDEEFEDEDSNMLERRDSPEL